MVWQYFNNRYNGSYYNKKGNLFIFYVCENNSFSLVQLTQIMDINHFISHYLLFIHKDRRRGACDCWEKPFILSDKYKRNNVNSFNETVNKMKTPKFLVWMTI